MQTKISASKMIEYQQNILLHSCDSTNRIQIFFSHIIKQVSLVDNKQMQMETWKKMLMLVLARLESKDEGGGEALGRHQTTLFNLRNGFIIYHTMNAIQQIVFVKYRSWQFGIAEFFQDRFTNSNVYLVVPIVFLF